MILKIDTTKSQEIVVELLDSKGKTLEKVAEKQVLGSQVLLPVITKLLKKNKKDFKDLTAVEVNTGPGSFTGTRVGVAVANALGFSLNIPVNGEKSGIAIPRYEKSKFD